MMDKEMEKLIVELTEFQQSHFFGKYKGIVEVVDDDEKLGRIKAKVPEVYGDTISPWAFPSVPFAGKNHGLVVLPEKGDGVWIEFEAGDVSRPIWVGAWWAKGEMPEPGGPKTRVLMTSKGHKLILDDDKNEIKILHSEGSEILMTDSDIKVTDKNGTNLMDIKFARGQIKIQAGLKVVIEAPEIELVEYAMQHVVFGEELLMYLNQLVAIYQTHTHPLEFALGVFPVIPMPGLPVPPLPPALPKLLSMRVKTG